MELVDWELAANTARRLAGPGPDLTQAEAAEVVRELRQLADEAHHHVVAYTGMVPDPALRTTSEVVDRGAWAKYNVQGMRATLGPLLDKIAARRLARGSAAESRTGALGRLSAVAAAGGVKAGRTATGVEVGSILAFLGSRVLGQYETFLPPGTGDGRLLLVAPNIVDVERRLGVDPRDFRMWVCVHEQTHHLQFTAAPWLQPHLRGLINRLADATDVDPRAVISRLRDSIRDRKSGDAPVGGPAAYLQSPEQRAVVREIQALMTLLEGHADQVMDAVGPAVIPSVGEIRTRFEARRREGGSPIDRLLRKVLGLDAKLEQYRVGGAFCRAVTTRGGPDAMRVAFAGPEYLPTNDELEAPDRWLARTSSARAAG